MFVIFETVVNHKTNNIRTSFGYNRVYDTYEEVERDLGRLVVTHLPEGDEVRVIRGPIPDTINIFSTDEVSTISIEVLNKKGASSK